MPAADQKPLGSGFSVWTTAEEVMAGVDLSGKIAVVTGGYGGIGLCVAKALVAAGAEVVAPARDPEKAREAFASEGLDIAAPFMDLANLASIYECAAEIGDAHDGIDILVNNAGVMACPETRVGPGWELQFAVNHIGHFLLTRELMPYLLNAGGARVITVSSVAHKRSRLRFEDIHFEREPYDKWIAYAQSKTANALFALGLHQRRGGDGIRSFSVHPGPVMTPLQRHVPVHELVALGWVNEDGSISEEAKQYVKTPSQGAATVLWAATSPLLDARGGEYCEDCDIAALQDAGSPRWRQVAPFAVDADEAKRLWAATEEMILAADA